MENNNFQFAKIEYIENTTFDGSLDSFYEKGIEGAIRENIQNSIDAKLETKEKVKVKIVLGKVGKPDLPGIDEVFQHIDSMEGKNEYTVEKINYMQSKKNEDSINVLTIEDLNTKGLSGAKNGQSGRSKDTFGSYAYRKGFHNKNENVEAEISRGGSHGIGKISNNAVSDINLMYFANCDELGEKHVGGSIHLIEHKHAGQDYRSTGYFSKKDYNNNGLYPFENQGYSKIFGKEERGLKIIIPYLREEFTDFKNIVTAICDNFFVAILNEKIEVEIIDKIKNKEIIINKSSLLEIVNDRKYYENYKPNIKKIFTPLYVQTLQEITNPEKLIVESLDDTYEFDLFFKYDEELPVGRVGIVRSMGMKIVDYKVERYIRRPYNAVLIGGPKEDGFLKTMENESHTQITSDNIKDSHSKKNARKFLRNLTTQMQRKIDESINRNSVSSGVLDTSHILSELDSTFSKNLSKSTEKVKIDSETTLLKKKPKERRKANKGSVFSKQKKEIQQRTPRKLKPSNEEEQGYETMILPNSSVERISLGDKEIIKFDFNNIDGSKNWTECDITFVVVDGMGQEHQNEARLADNYMLIKDAASNDTYTFNDYKINNVKIKNNTSIINLIKYVDVKDSLKYLYKIEVRKNDI